MKPLTITKNIKMLNEIFDKKFLSTSRWIDGLTDTDKKQFMKHLDMTIPKSFNEDTTKRGRKLLYNVILHFLFFEKIKDTQDILDILEKNY